MMKKSAFFCNKLDYFSGHSSDKPPRCFSQSCTAIIRSLFRVLVFHVNPFYVQLIYFVFVSIFGYLALRVIKPARTSFRPEEFDLFFTSVSATTVSSMSTVEMEVFSNTHLIFLTILMFLGGEVFISMVGLKIANWKMIPKSYDDHHKKKIMVDVVNNKETTYFDQIELGFATDISHSENPKPPCGDHVDVDTDHLDIKSNSIRMLCYVILGYLLVVHIGGSTLVSSYITLVPSARKILKTKGLEIQTFSIFTTVSTFANCGFVPTNENMIIFKKNSGLLLLLIPQILLGNTLYPPCLRVLIRVLAKITRREEFSYMLNNYKDLGYNDHLLSGAHSFRLALTVLSFIVVQTVLFCAMEWRSEALDGLSAYQKFVASIFQTTNSRHSGESVVDLSVISPAILVLFVVMMYLPPHTTFFPTVGDCEESASENIGRGIGKPKQSLVQSLIFSQLSYLAIFIILICITERESMKEDPLNFNLLSITTEVISAYGNVGFTMGYSCERRLNHQTDCKEALYGLAGRWSTGGKFILILVMFFGRLKKFSMKKGKAWKLS